MEINLIEKQKEVNEKCGFQADNLDGLILGLISEIGELASVVALKEGLKKPKPKDLEKFGRWTKNHAGYIIDTSMFVEVINSKESGFRKYRLGPFSFEEAFNHERTQSALKGNISEELADVLVYLLQLCICTEYLNPDFNFSTKSQYKYSSVELTLFLVHNAGEFTYKLFKADIIEAFTHLHLLAQAYQIDLQQAYLNKCEKLLKR